MYIQLRLRYKTDDWFWFTFFHEAVHVVSLTTLICSLAFLLPGMAGFNYPANKVSATGIRCK